MPQAVQAQKIGRGRGFRGVRIEGMDYDAGYGTLYISLKSTLRFGV